MTKIKAFIRQYKKVLIIAVILVATLLSWKLMKTFSEDANDSTWDGVAARSFTSGTGTEANPYVISNASEYAYFKSLLEGEDASAYINKNYVINHGFNYGEYEININNEIPFSGTIDGKGSLIYNAKVVNSLFNEIENATIKNINFDDIDYSLVNESGALFAKEMSNSEINMVLFSGNVTISDEVNNLFGGFVHTSNNNKYNNIIINSKISCDSNQNFKFVYVSFEDEGTNILVNNDDCKNSKDELNFKINNFEIVDNKINLIDIENIDNYMNDDYRLAFLNDKFVIEKIETETQKQDDAEKEEKDDITPNKAPVKRNAVASDTITEHASGSDGNTLYINDLTADKNYLKGLNYAEVRNTSLPSGVSTGYYDDNYLVKVEIIYDGADINNSSLVGALSPINNENTNKFVYFKYYPLVRNSNGSLATNSDGDNYIRIELIDNPFTKRPYVNNVEYGFNGWACNQSADTTANLCENATFSFRKADYTRYMDIPVNGGSQLIIHLNATWYRADVVTSYNDIYDFNSMSMQPTWYTTTETVTHRYNAYWKQNYTQMEYDRSYNYNAGYLPVGVWYRTNRNRGTYYYVSQANSVRADRYWGNTTLYAFNANTTAITQGTRYTGGSITFVANFNPTGSNTDTTINNYNTTYMNLVEEANGTFTTTEQVTHSNSYISTGANTEGYYYKVSNPTANMISTGEYYTDNGSVCTSANACTTAYKLIQYNDSVTNSNGNSIYLTEDNNGYMLDADKYYYLVTRDMNIYRHTSTTGVSYTNLTYYNRPFTVTGAAVNGTTAAGRINITSNQLSLKNDLVIENIRIDGPNYDLTVTGRNGYDNKQTGADTTSGAIYANSHNLKIGRNVSSYDGASYMVVQGIYGGANNASPSGTFRVIVESGYYYAYHSGRMNGGTTSYTFNETTIFGNDYDRIKNNNQKLRFLIGLDGYAGGDNYAGSDSLFASYNIIKSGSFGYNYDGSANTDNTAGLYIGARSDLYMNSLTGVKIEGGLINTVVGGYGYNGTNTTNSTFIGMSGGSVRSIYGGAGHSTTKGNRIVCVTGGTVSYSILGGSDSYNSGYTDDGIVQGSTLVYVGGNVTVGGGSGELYGVESGSVFGAGGGDTSSTQKGTVYNSHVIINGGTINTSVYGGGNHGSTGTQYAGTSTTQIDILAGTIGSVFGGSKSADFGQSGYESSSTIDINISGGTIGNVYGGSNTEGTIYGSIDMDITGGTITSNVYGGGQGSQTVVSRDVDVTIGNNTAGPTVRGNVYGGSAYGTVNSANAGEVNVTVNKGTITGSVFGGGQGSSTYTPYVNGDITVTVNGGTIGNVFGGNDQAGNHTKNNEVHLNGGTITNVYGGGNLSSVTNTHVYLDGATVTDLYGGSNTSGNVSTTTVVVTSGSVGNVYGGNNAGGTDGSTSVDVKDGTVTGNIYGGGKGNATVVSGDVDVTIGDSSAGPTISGSVYGGSAFGTVNSANSGEVNVTVNKGTITGSVFGGGQGSTTYTPYVNGDITVTINDGDITAVFGGNDQAGSHTKNNEVHLNGGTIESVYGGGNRSSVTNTNVYMDGATVTNIYGGSNTLGNVTTTNVDITSGTVQNVYGGNNEGGTCGTTDVNVTGTATINGSVYGGGNEVNTATTTVTLNSANGTIPNVYGGGNSASVTTSTVTNNGVTATNIFGGSNSSGTVSRATITNNSGMVTNVYGGNNAGGNTLDATINMVGGTAGTIYGGGNQANGGKTNVLVSGGTVGDVFGGGNSAGLNESHVHITGGTFTGSVYGGSNNTGTLDETDIVIDNNPTINAIYGGGNRAQAGDTSVVINGGTIGSVYGGGNLAQVTGDTLVDINGGSISGNVYGGGNFGVVKGSSEVTITNATVLGSAYAGGNGSSATLEGNTNITIDGNTVIGSASSVAPTSGCVFDGGNQAYTGLQANNDSTSNVNIVGGTIYGNVYGGANTSVVYGNTIVNIGKTAYTSNNLTKSDIHIYGNVFGGGEANASGSPIYDWSYISVTEGVNITVDAEAYNNFQIDGSFFGGGNASTASGDSYLLIRNYGSGVTPKHNVSIQRVTYVTIDNSSILLTGAIDRANEYDDELFTISRVDEMKLQNNSYLFLARGANLLKDFKSLDDEGNPAIVEIDVENNEITDISVDNRIYLYEGRQLNIAKDQQGNDCGNVTGMTFFGIFNFASGDVNTGMYNPSYEPGDTLNNSLLFAKGSVIKGKHMANHDITVNGFYSNFMNDETKKNEINYVDPTPKNAQHYLWHIGENVVEYNVNLTASKYSTLGSVEFAFDDLYKPNTSFQIDSFDISDIAPGVTLVDKNNIPRIASTSDIANNVFGLAIEASNSGWLTSGKTSFYTSDPFMSGITYYEGENSTVVPTMLFYLYHSKNLTETKSLGTVRISISAITRINALSSEITRLVVNVNMSSAFFQTNEYEGAMTPGDKYDLFTSTATNITTKSKFSAYYGLYGAGSNLYQTGYHRALTSSYVLPVGTKITMLDFSLGAPEYYYHVITQNDYNAANAEFGVEGECSYNLSMFTKMGSLNSNTNYNDAAKNALYYDGTNSSEEFIFIVDFSDTTISEDHMENSLLLEMRDADDESIINVLGIQHSQLTYNLYYGKDSTIDETVTASDNPLYIGYNDIFEVNIDYQNSSLSGTVITDTQHFDSKLGVQISITDAEGRLVSGTDLTGAYFLMDGVRYYPDIAGYTHIKLVDKIGNAKKWITFNTENANIPTGSYTFKFEAFASPDGIYYSSGEPDIETVSITIINSTYGLNPVLDEDSIIFSANNDKSLNVTTYYTSLLNNPSIRIAMYRRQYDEVYDTDYTLVDFQDYVVGDLTTTNIQYEYLLTGNPQAVNENLIRLESELLTGTYRLSFRLYDSNTMIGEINRYIVIK